MTYAARPAYALIAFDQLATTVPLASYCLSKTDLAPLDVHPANDRSFVARQYAVPVGFDGKPVAKLQVSVMGSGKRAATHAWTAFCGADGRAIIGRATDVSATAQPDSMEVVHILKISGY